MVLKAMTVDFRQKKNQPTMPSWHSRPPVLLVLIMRNHAMRGNNQHYARMTHPNPQRHVGPTAVLTRSRIVPLSAARLVNTVVPQTKVQPQRPTTHGVNKAHSPIRRPINLRLSPQASNFPPKVTTAKASQGNPQHALKDKGIIDNGCSRHMTGNMSYLTNFEEINGGYVAFGGNPKGGYTDALGRSKSVMAWNTDDDATFEVKEPEFEVKKPEFVVYVSPSKSAKTKKHDGKTTREAKGKSPVKFPTLGKSLYVDPSQYPDDLNMLSLEDITYSNDEEDVSAEVGFSNLETNITVSPIPTTRVHKDHLVTQISGDLSSSPQTRSMTRMIREQEFEDPDYLDKVYKVVKALYGLHQAPRAWYETLANYLLENGFHKGQIDQTLFIKKQKDGKSASTLIDTEKPLLKDPDGEDVDVHTYRPMIGSLMYLTLSRPDIMFAIFACAYFQVTPKASHLHVVKRIFSMKLLERTLYATNVLSAGYITTPQMVLNSPCLTHIKN
nr:hypothetical protein [Tanacetum cinerariifolium]